VSEPDSAGPPAPDSAAPDSAAPDPAAPAVDRPGILHVDLDAFYASVEQLADPSLRGRPVVVGGLGPRGVVAAASYEARRFGVHSAMPMARARRACPDAAFLAPRFDAYGDASREVMTILRSFTPLVEPLALDEAFLDVRGVLRLHGPAPDIARAARERVRNETGLTASVGIATTKFLAKIASDLAKPDGVLIVEAGDELEFLHPLAVGRLWGVGPATRRRLDRFGVRTIGDLAALSEATLVGGLGRAHGAHLHALAWNHDDRAVEPVRRVKSVGHEETFATDLTEREPLGRELVRMSEKVASRLRHADCVARTVQLKVRYGDFHTITRSRTLVEPTDLAADIVRTATQLLDAVDIAGGIRLLGVSAQQLEPADSVQTALALDDGDAAGGSEVDDRTRREQRGRLERSVDSVRDRYGDGAVVPASLVRSRSDDARDESADE
jgi:DNA polymerase-4